MAASRRSRLVQWLRLCVASLEGRWLLVDLPPLIMAEVASERRDYELMSAPEAQPDPSDRLQDGAAQHLPTFRTAA
jgi:hypothetical protein